MTQTNPATLGRDLRDFSQRLEARIREFESEGEFSAVHDAFVNTIRKRHSELSNKVDEAIRRGTTWDVIKSELTSDYESLFDTLLRWEERLDTESMKKRGV